MIKKKRMYRIFAFMSFIACVITCISSCAYRYEPLFKEERFLFRNEIESVAILPFTNNTAQQGVINEASEIFASELARFREINVVHPAIVMKYLRDEKIVLTPENMREVALDIGRFFGVESVLIGTVTEANEFYPPIFGFSVVILKVTEGATIFSKSVVYDSSFNYVREELTHYTAYKNLSDSLYKEDIVLHKYDLYMRFVSHQMIRKYL